MTYEDLLYEVDDRVAIITFNRPSRMNAFGKRLVNEIVTAVAQADADPEVRVLMLTGAGDRAFSTGFDLKETAEAPRKTLPEWRARMQSDIRFSFSVWDCSKPVIAVIDGYCLGGALELAQCCDVRYCSDAARFGFVEARFGSGIATMMMPWIMGPRCREYIYSGDMFEAAEAFQIGLVNRVIPKADLRAEALKRAKRMARVADSCLKWNKRAINHAFETMGLRAAIQYGAEACAIMDASGSPENDKFDEIRRTENVAAALKWREAQFKPYE